MDTLTYKSIIQFEQIHYLPFVNLLLKDVGMHMEFTAVYKKVPEGYIAFVEELPGVNTQGATLEEARSNLEEAIELVLEANRTLAEETLVGEDIIREPIPITS